MPTMIARCLPRSMRSLLLLVIAIGDAANGLTSRQLAFQEQFLAGRNVGLAGMLMTGGVVRHIYPGELRPEGWQPSFATALARAVGARVRPTFRSSSIIEYPKTVRRPCGASRRNTSRVCRLPGSRMRSWSSVLICRIRTRFARRCRGRKAVPSCPGSSFTRRRLRSCSTACRCPVVGAPVELSIVVLAVLLRFGRLPFAPLRLHWKAAIAFGVLAAYWAVGFGSFALGGPCCRYCRRP